MVHTVGAAGVNGNLGVPTTKALVKAAEEGKINLVIFHRDGNKPKDIESGPSIEFRILDYSDPVENIEAAVKGINVFVSLVAIPAVPHEPKLVDALAKSSECVTYLPSVYSTTWEAEDFKDAQLGPLLSFIHQGWHRAKEIGLGVTAVYCGAFDMFFFQQGFLGAPIKENAVAANEKQLQNGIPITNLDHLGQAIAEIAISDPQTIRNRDYSVVSFWPTGQELLDLYTKINGQQAKHINSSDDAADAKHAGSEEYAPLVRGYKTKWENAGFTYTTGGKITIDNYQGPSIEEIARLYA